MICVWFVLQSYKWGKKLHLKNDFNFGFHCTVYVLCMEKDQFDSAKAKINIEHLKKMLTWTISV